MELLICQYCGSERKNKKSLANHQRCCPLNANRKYTNNKVGKKGSNQFLKADSLGVERPKGNITFGMLGKTQSDETKRKISIKMKENHKRGISYNRGRWKFYEENRDKTCNFYVAIFSHQDFSFIKIGITERSFSERYSNLAYKKYNKILLYENIMYGLDALTIERQFLNKYKPNSHFDIKQFDENFVGHTECLDIRVLNEIKTDIWSIPGESVISKIKTLEFESPIDHHI